MDSADEWMAGYRRAWLSNDADDIRSLFTEDAVYRRTPFAEPWVGREAIVAAWLAIDDQPELTTFEWTELGVADGLAVVEGRTGYPELGVFSNLWLLRLEPDGRVSQYREWWMRDRRARSA